MPENKDTKLITFCFIFLQEKSKQIKKEAKQTKIPVFCLNNPEKTENNPIKNNKKLFLIGKSFLKNIFHKYKTITEQKIEVCAGDEIKS